MNLKSIIEKIIYKIKKQEYKLDDLITTSDLISVLFHRVLLLIRGIFKRIGLKECGKVIFIDKGVKFYSKRHIRIKDGVTIGIYAELDGLSEEGINIGNNVKIGNFTQIKCTGTLKKIGRGFSIEDNSGVGEFSFFGAAGGIKIGRNVIMGQNIRFHSENHNFDRLDVPIKEQGVTNKGIIIEDDCWFGSGVVVLDGVTVGKGSVLGANTLVNKDIPPYSIAVGNPVKIIKSRLELKK
jgi:acetyltransferase-like isoleucine patch superfamily enzyme